MEPVRIKVYGLFRQTRRSYILQSIFGLGYGVALLILWWFRWPSLQTFLARPELELPTYMKVTVAVLKVFPLILLIAAIVKAFEMWIILRRFTEKEAQQLANPTKTSPQP